MCQEALLSHALEVEVEVYFLQEEKEEEGEGQEEEREEEGKEGDYEEGKKRNSVPMATITQNVFVISILFGCL